MKKSTVLAMLKEAVVTSLIYHHLKKIRLAFPNGVKADTITTK